jgi:hypothetical protein
VTEEDAVLALHYAQAYTRLAMRWILGERQPETLRRSSGGATTEDDVIYLARLTKNCPPPIPVPKRRKK